MKILILLSLLVFNTSAQDLESRIPIDPNQIDQVLNQNSLEYQQIISAVMSNPSNNCQESKLLLGTFKACKTNSAELTLIKDENPYFRIDYNRRNQVQPIHPPMDLSI